MKRFLVFWLALAVAWPVTAQTVRTKSTSSVKESEVSRDFELEKAVQARLRRLAAVMKEEARVKLNLATQAVLARLAAGPDNAEPYTIARREVRGRFQRLSADQSELFVFYVLADAARRISSGETKAVKGESEMMTLSLQMTMDKSSKFIQTLSNIMKKISATQDAIVQNIK